MNNKTKIKLSEQYKKSLEEAKSILEYMITHFTGLAQALQSKWWG